MAQSKDKQKKMSLISTDKVVAENRRARFDYHLEDKYEAGIVLQGTEVKSLRQGKCSLNESYATINDGEAFLINAHIPEYTHTGPKMQHEPNRPRKLLLKSKEIKRLVGSISRDGYTLVPVKLYFDKRGLAKLELALAKGKQTHDKRETVKKRDWQRRKARIMREN